MTTSTPASGERPEVPPPGVDAVPLLDQEDAGTAQGERDGEDAQRNPGRMEESSDAERAGTMEDEAEAVQRHGGA